MNSVSRSTIKILLFLGLPFITIPSSAVEWTFAGTNTSPALTNGLRTELPRALNAILATSSLDVLHSYVPPNIAVQIDPQWRLSAGFFSPTLLGPQGQPSLIFSPEYSHDSSQGFGRLVHELIHLLHFEKFKQAQPSLPRATLVEQWGQQNWIEEGIALLSERLVTGNYNRVILEGFRRPETSLIASLNPTEEQASRAAQYGHVGQFFEYAYRLCGERQWLQQILNNQRTRNGLEIFSGASSNPNCAHFSLLFKDFERARAIQNLGRPQDFAVPMGLKMAVRQAVLPLPPYTACLYQKTPGGTCPGNDIPIVPDKCLRIREQ